MDVNHGNIERTLPSSAPGILSRDFEYEGLRFPDLDPFQQVLLPNVQGFLLTQDLEAQQCLTTQEK
jgi:hypothetical protein